MRLRSRLVAALALGLTGCSATTPPEHADALPTYSVGDETVHVSEVDQLYAGYPSLEAFVARVPVVVVGTVTATKEIAAELPPDPGAEGYSPGDGPDLFGSITITVHTTLKGSPPPGPVTVFFDSGKRDGSNAKNRVTYVYDGLSLHQHPDGRLRSPGDLAGRSFALFLKPGDPGHAVYRQGFKLAHPIGVAQVGDGGVLTFAGERGAPVRVDGRAATVTVDAVRDASRPAGTG